MNGELMEDYKDLEIENEQLRSQLNELKSKNIDVSNYKQWKFKQIFQWILSLDNGRYIQYSQQLEVSLKEEDINGEDLCQVDAGDIKSWGIVNFRDKKYLLHQIQQLIAPKSVEAEGTNELSTGYVSH